MSAFHLISIDWVSATGDPTDHKPFYSLSGVLPMLQRATTVEAWFSRLQATFKCCQSGYRAEPGGLKWSERSPSPCGTNLLYHYNEPLSVTGLQASSFEGWSFPPRPARWMCTDGFGRSSDTSHQVSTFKPITHISFIFISSWKKVFESILHLSPPRSRDFIQYAACITSAWSTAAATRQCKHFSAILFLSVTPSRHTSNWGASFLQVLSLATA